MVEIHPKRIQDVIDKWLENKNTVHPQTIYLENKYEYDLIKHENILIDIDGIDNINRFYLHNKYVMAKYASALNPVCVPETYIKLKKYDIDNIKKICTIYSKDNFSWVINSYDISTIILHDIEILSCADSILTPFIYNKNCMTDEEKKNIYFLNFYNTVDDKSIQPYMFVFITHNNGHRTDITNEIKTLQYEIKL